MKKATCESCNHEYYYDANQITLLKRRDYATVVECRNRVRLFLKEKEFDSYSSRRRHCVRYCSRRSCQEPSDVHDSGSGSETGSDSDSDTGSDSDTPRKEQRRPNYKDLSDSEEEEESESDDDEEDVPDQAVVDEPYRPSSRDLRKWPSLNSSDSGVDDHSIDDENFVVSDDFVEYEDETSRHSDMSRTVGREKVRTEPRTGSPYAVYVSSENSRRGTKRKRQDTETTDQDGGSSDEGSHCDTEKMSDEEPHHSSWHEKPKTGSKLKYLASRDAERTKVDPRKGPAVIETSDSDDNQSDEDANGKNEDEPLAMTLSTFVRKMRRLRGEQGVTGIYYAYAGQIILEKDTYKAFFLMVGNQHGVFYDSDDDVYVQEGNFKTINSDVFLAWLDKVVKKLPENSRLVLDASTWQYREFMTENSQGTNKTIMTRNICARLKYYDWSFIPDPLERAGTKRKFHHYFNTLNTSLVTASMMKQTLTVDLMRELINEMHFEKCISDQICKENGVKIVRQPPNSKNLNFIRHVVMYIQDNVRYKISDIASITNAIKRHIRRICDDTALLEQLFEDLETEEEKALDQ
ncbi:hypothetical protein HDE_11118 [Halotydeus destructor]|nr:hypothetical protein HDE_11118 [Halotydeus destructor]